MKKSLKVYLAAAWHRQAEMVRVAKELREDGLVITSRWLHEVPATGPNRNRSRIKWAKRDVEDVRAADILVRFADDLSRETVPAKLATGSRMFEMGLAYERGMRVVVVGGYQPIFDYLPEVIHVRHTDELRSYLVGLKTEKRRGR